MNAQKAKRVLRSIQKIPHEQFVLHGSLRRSNTLLPNRPSLWNFTHKRKAKGIREKAVYGTRLVAVAVVYATLPNDVMWRLQRKQVKVLFLEQELQLFSGFIHVCRKEGFNRGALSPSSRRPAKVVRTFKVTPDMFLHLWDAGDIKLVSHW